MKPILIVLFLLSRAPEVLAQPTFGTDYFEWKKCSKNEECVLVNSAPPCNCGPDSINKKYLKSYEQKLSELTRYWKEKKDLPSCEPCSPKTNATPDKPKCKKQCYVL